ncbi:MAG: ATP-binding cassette domain-containing protein [Hyphomicrobiales bacterium]|nr:ATP-binding cassette domain-containing protein [Hyphomicrobiales bacterium]MDE2115427.1 ATP-binding cassette domain-containing protein [Hyphomicrobiales bacterium]
MNETIALDVAGVSHSYGSRKALDDVSFQVEQGQFCVLLGPNGAGKSTLLSLVTRLFAMRHGSISIFGHDVSRQSGEALRRMGVVFQARTLDLDLTVAQNLIYHAALHGIGRAQTRTLAASVLARVGMADRASDKARDLSGGQMRRVEIARALLHAPRLLLLDEPTVGLDMQARTDILAYVRRLVQDDQIGVLWTTHLLDEINNDDRVIVMHKGKVLDQGLARDTIIRHGARDIKDAFAKMTGSEPLGLGAAIENVL